MYSDARLVRGVAPLSGICIMLSLLLALCVHPPLQAQEGPRLDVGAICGFEFTDGVEDPRLGALSEIGFGRFGVTAAFALVQQELPMEWSGSGWQLYLTGRIRIFGPRSWLSLGYGLTIEHRTANWSFLDRTDRIYNRTSTTDAALVGVGLPVGRFRPFADIVATRLLDRDGTVGGHALFGLTVNVL
jgi:hypothetical protein